MKGYRDYYMKEKPLLIVMLTYNDKTIVNALDAFEKCKNSSAEYWGIKEEGLSLLKMKELFTQIKRNGKKAVLEVVAYTEDECLEGAKIAAECGCDILMGTMFFESVNVFCKENDIKYMPFVGNVSGRPSVLSGSIDEMIVQAKEYIEKGVFGIDLLAYRFIGNSTELIRRFLSEVKVPVCIAGSVNSFDRLNELKNMSPWAYTIGSSFFDNDFGNDLQQQIEIVCNYMKEIVNV